MNLLKFRPLGGAEIAPFSAVPSLACQFAPRLNLSEVLKGKPLQLIDQGTRSIACLAGDTVVKLFKTPESVADSFAFLQQDLGQVGWAPVPGDAVASGRKLVEGAMTSTVLAAERIADYTGILAVNFQPSEEIEFEIEEVGNFNTATHPLYIQKRVTPVIDLLREYASRGDTLSCKLLLDNVLSVILGIISRGLWQHTYGVDYNYGLDADGRLLHIDTGEYQEGENWKLKDPKECGSALLQDTLPELMAEFPELGMYLSTEADRRLRI